jgi:hypothetical protein
MYLSEPNGGLRTIGPARAPPETPNSSTLFAPSQLLVHVGGGFVGGGQRSTVTFSGFPPLKIPTNGTSAVYFRKTIWAQLQGKRAVLAVGHSMDAVPFVDGYGGEKTTVFVARRCDQANRSKPQ